MKVIVAALVVFLVGSCQAQKEARAYCVLDVERDEVTMYLTLDLKGESVGNFTAIDNTQYEKAIKNYSRILDGCDINYSNGLYMVKSVVSKDGSSSMENGCGVVRQVDSASSLAFPEWIYLYTTDDDQFLGENDKVYIVECKPDKQLKNIMTTTMTVLTPNIDQNVPIQKPVIDFDILIQGAGGIFGPASSANAGDMAKLQLALTRASDFNVGNNNQVYLYGLYGFTSYAWHTPQATGQYGSNGRDLLIDGHSTEEAPTKKGVVVGGGGASNKSGTMYIMYIATACSWMGVVICAAMGGFPYFRCPFDGSTLTYADPGSQVPPTDGIPTGGYIGAASPSGDKYFSITGPFKLWKYKGKDTVHFVTYLKTFFYPQKDALDDPCTYLTNPAGRKKRSDLPEYQVTLSTYITIKSPNLDDGKSTDELTSRQLAITLGAVAAVVFVMLIAGLVCLVVVMTSRRREEKHLESSRSSSTASIIIQDRK